MTWLNYRTLFPTMYFQHEPKPIPKGIEVVLSKDETNALFRGALNIALNPYKIDEQENFIVNSKKLKDCFSSKTRQKIETELENGFGAVLIKNLPQEVSLPKTPSKGGNIPETYKTTFVSEAMLIALGNLTNAEPFNFRQEGMGTAPLIDNIVPVQALKSQKGAGGYDNNFPFHCESAWHRKRPDYLVLLGLREHMEAKTLIFSSSMLEEGRWPLNDLKTGCFRLKAPDLYLQMEEQGLPMGTPAFTVVDPIELTLQGLRLNINFNGTDCQSREDGNWLNQLESYIENKAVYTVIKPGSALILNNNRTCHTRSGYTPVFDGYDRWFIRGYFCRKLWNSPSGSSSQSRITDKEIQALIDLGWLTERHTLTNLFTEFTSQSRINNLSSTLSHLITVAYHFTPMPNSRII